MEDAHISRDAKVACENLRYDFSYNESENTIDISYGFFAAIPEDSVVQFVPHAHTIRYRPPKHRGRKPALDAIFDDPQKMLSITKQAEADFERGLGQTIDAAIQLFIHQTMYRCGAMEWKKTSKEMADLFAGAFRADIATQLKVKPGPQPLLQTPIIIAGLCSTV